MDRRRVNERDRSEMNRCSAKRDKQLSPFAIWKMMFHTSSSVNGSRLCLCDYEGVGGMKRREEWWDRMEVECKQSVYPPVYHQMHSP